MERQDLERLNSYLVGAISALALSSCSEGGYNTDPSSVQCDVKRTIADLPEDGMTTFVVHGNERGEVGIVQVRRSDESVSVATESEIAGPPQQLELDGFTEPVPIEEGPELSAFAAGVAWVIDARRDTVVIHGTCNEI